MKASYFGQMGYSDRSTFPTTWPTPPGYTDSKTSVQSYQDGMEECEFAEEMGFDWISFSEHHYSGRIPTGTPSVMAAAVAERCKKVTIAMLGHLLPLNNPVRIAEEVALLDNITNGRVVAGNTERGPGLQREPGGGPRPAVGGDGPHHKGAYRTPTVRLGGPLLSIPHGGRLAPSSAATAAPGGCWHQKR